MNNSIVVEGTVSGEVAMHFTTCERLDACVVCSIMPRPEPQPFTGAMADQLPKQLDHNPKAHNIGYTSLTFDTT